MLIVKDNLNSVPWVWFDEFHDLFHRDVVFNPDGLTEIGAYGRRDVPRRVEGDRKRKPKSSSVNEDEIELRRLAASERYLTAIETFQRQQQQ